MHEWYVGFLEMETFPQISIITPPGAGESVVKQTTPGSYSLPPIDARDIHYTDIRNTLN